MALNRRTGVTTDVRSFSRPGGQVAINQSLLGDIGGFVVDTIKDEARRRLAGTGGDSGSDSPFSDCPEGTFPNPIGTGCVRVDAGAALPGGDPFVSLDREFGDAVIGAFGIPAIVPAVVGTIRDAQGREKPIRKCPFGAVLGKDDLCYNKGSIPKQFRKWRPAPKPPMSAADAKALRRIGTLQKKVKGLAKSANLTCKRK